MRVSALFGGQLIHARGGSVSNSFRYPICFAGIDVDELAELDRSLRLFGHNRRSLFALRDRDYAGAGSLGLRGAVEELTGRSPERIVLLTQLATFGYVFNPVSFFLCYDARDELAFAVAEVNNTYGGSHRYVLDDSCRVDTPGNVYRTRKQFYVSPYVTDDCHYIWQLPSTGSRRADQDVRMRVVSRERPIFAARLHGVRRELSDLGLVRAGVRYPLMPQAIISLIHLQALKLWSLGLQYRDPPDHDVARRQSARPPAGAVPAPEVVDRRRARVSRTERPPLVPFRPR